MKRVIFAVAAVAALVFNSCERHPASELAGEHGSSHEEKTTSESPAVNPEPTHAQTKPQDGRVQIATPVPSGTATHAPAIPGASAVATPAATPKFFPDAR